MSASRFYLPTFPRCEFRDIFDYLETWEHKRSYKTKKAVLVPSLSCVPGALTHRGSHAFLMVNGAFFFIVETALVLTLI